MSFGQNVALVMVNKLVKFDENSLHFEKLWQRYAENRQIYEMAIYGKVTSTLAAMFFNETEFFEGI